MGIGSEKNLGKYVFYYFTKIETKTQVDLKINQ